MLFENTKAASTVMERLATGSKINKAQDDVAGSAISDRMTAQVRGLNMALKNAGDAQEFMQILDGMYADQTDIVQRIRELTVQAANDTNSLVDREYLQTEVGSLVAEVQRLHAQTMFNGEVIGSGNRKFQVGADAGQTIDFFVSIPSQLTGSIYGLAAGAYAANDTVIEVQQVSKTGPFVHGDIVYIGSDPTQSRFISSVATPQINSDGSFTQAITLSDGLATDVAAGTLVAATASYDVTAPAATAFTFGGRGSLARIDLINDASGSLEGIDTALESIADIRARTGTTSNRIDFVISNLISVSEQTTIARSRIEDADFATESAALAKTQVLQQTATAMLAQANASPRLVLQLVK
jgi:flagellin